MVAEPHFPTPTSSALGSLFLNCGGSNSTLLEENRKHRDFL